MNAVEDATASEGLAAAVPKLAERVDKLGELQANLTGRPTDGEVGVESSGVSEVRISAGAYLGSNWNVHSWGGRLNV